MTTDETPYTREPGYAERYRDRRFRDGSGPSTHRREAAAIGELLDTLPTPDGRPWLDAPCGAGRLSDLLPGPPVLADRDLAMVAAAPADRARFCASVHQLPFVDDAFAGVLCMRLLHHIAAADERRRILSELARVSRGPVVVSFFHAVSLQHARRVFSRLTRRKPRSGRCAVTWRQFRRDLAAAGLQVRAVRPLRRFVSEQWLVLASA